MTVSKTDMDRVWRKLLEDTSDPPNMAYVTEETMQALQRFWYPSYWPPRGKIREIERRLAP